MKEKLKSRKLWIAVASIIVGAVYPESVPLIKWIAGTYIGSQGVVDTIQALKKGS